MKTMKLSIAMLLALGLIGATPVLAQDDEDTIDVVDENATPDEVMNRIELPEDAAPEALEASAFGLDTANNEARERGRDFGQERAEQAQEFGQDQAEQAREQGQEFGQDQAEQAREQAQEFGQDQAEQAREQAQEFGQDQAEQAREQAQEFGRDQAAEARERATEGARDRAVDERIQEARDTAAEASGGTAGGPPDNTPAP